MQVIEAGYQVDRYTVERMLGQGGVAHVYLVRHNELGSLHALKVLQVPLGTHQSRLLTEGRVQSALNHPNIVNVTDVVEIDGSPGLIMEYVAGPSLDELLKSHLLTIAQIDSIAREILAGVATAHQLGLVHRDLKPANVLLAPTPQGPVAKVTDFGLAKFLDLPEAQGVTRTGVALGTPAYMAPEQIRDSKGIDARADVFSLGAVLYELTTGKKAFSGNDTMELFEAIIKGRYLPLAEVAPGLPPRMVKAIEGALEPDLNQRFADAGRISQVWCADSPRPMPNWSEDLLFLESLSPDPTSSASLARSNPTFAPHHTVAAEVAESRLVWWSIAIAVLTAIVVVVTVAVTAVVLWPEPQLPIGDAPIVSSDPLVQEKVVRGWRAMLDGDLESAQRAFVGVAERAPDEAMAHFLVSTAYGLDQVYGKSARALDAAANRLDEDNKWARLIELNIIALTVPTRPTAEEWQALSDAHQRDYLTQIVLAQWAGQPLRSEAAARLVELKPTPLAYVIATKAHGHLPDKAEELAQEMVQRYPDAPIAWEALGILKVRQRDWAAARDAFTRALEANPSAALSRLNLANTWETLGDLEQRNHHRSLAYGETSSALVKLKLYYLEIPHSFGMGRPAEAALLTQQCMKLGEEQTEYMALLYCADMMWWIGRALGDADLVAMAVDGYKVAIDSPEIPAVIVDRMRTASLGMRATEAAYRHDVSTARHIVDRLVGLEDRQLFGMARENVVGDVQRIIAESQGDFQPWLDHYAAGDVIGRPCFVAREEARIQFVAGHHIKAAQSYEALLADEGPCGPTGEDRYFQAEALVTLAELEPDTANKRFAQLQAMWPAPELSNPVMKRMQAMNP